MISGADDVARRAVVDALARLDTLPLPDPRVVPPLALLLATPPRREDDPKPPGTSTELGLTATRRRAGHPAPAAGPKRAGPADRAPTVVEALTALETGRTSTRQLVEESLAAWRRTTSLGAVVALDEEAALAEAEVLDAERRAGSVRGPLHGIPVTVKDVIDVAGLPTRAGSLAYEDEPKLDAGAVGRLRDAGALLLAKVATHEFALGVATPQCRNPHDPSRISGGSSGGSAIAVATGVGLASLGTDTRASLRVPASLCGVVGLKPTFGLVPTDGIVPLSWTFNHIGPIARDVADASLLLGVLAGEASIGAVAPAPAAPAVGFVAAVLADAEPDVTAACEAALGALEQAGARLVELELPGVAELELSNELGLIVSRSEAATYHRGRGTDLELCIPEVRDQLRASMAIRAVDYLDAQRQRQLLAERVLSAFAHCDVIVSPTTALVAPRRDDYERFLLRLSRNTIVWSLAGCPAISLPCGYGAGGLPIGLQLAARPFAERALIEAARLVEGILAA